MIEERPTANQITTPRRETERSKRMKKERKQMLTNEKLTEWNN